MEGHRNGVSHADGGAQILFDPIPAIIEVEHLIAKLGGFLFGTLTVDLAPRFLRLHQAVDVVASPEAASEVLRVGRGDGLLRENVTTQVAPRAGRLPWATGSNSIGVEDGMQSQRDCVP